MASDRKGAIAHLSISHRRASTTLLNSTSSPSPVDLGSVRRTTNFGETWEILPLPTQPNATVWGLATHPADADGIVAFSLSGEVYVSEDAGASWCKIAREFGEIRAAVWVPN